MCVWRRLLCAPYARGVMVAIPFSFLAARDLTGRSRLSVWIYYLTRSVFNVLRSIDALMYVAFFVFWVGFGAYGQYVDMPAFCQFYAQNSHYAQGLAADDRLKFYTGRVRL